MTQKSRLMLVTTRLGGGGAEKHLVRIANQLVNDFDVQIETLRPGGSYSKTCDSRIQIDCVGPKWTNRSTLLASRFGTKKLRRRIIDSKPECIVSFLEPATYTTHFALEKLQNPTPPHLVAIQNNPRKTMELFRSFWKRWMVTGVAAAIKSSNGIVAISNGVGECAEELFPGSKDKSTTIYNAAFEELPSIDIPIEANIQSLPRRTVQLVACGRLAEQKGFCDLIEAMRIATQKVDVGLWLLGTGPLENELKDQARNSGLEDRIDFLGFQDDPFAYYRASDAFILSSWWEGFGNVIVEAMSTETAVVATDCPYGPSEIIEHEHNGLLVPCREPATLADGIIRIANDDSLRSKMATNGRVRAADFSAQVIANQYRDLVNEYVASRKT